ncbi:extracellular catalytic domain type 1 short-chain-length polyhydroxyalkanoate depolymerase [Rugamonas rubra]|uniref:Esterase, PHB depolymerase family n=1 Tax=Rugamonas rubra TaxID=758825 RepID=A0A1I4KFY5_9BURK|nr:esterase, PHB depolymerase family [Rugamonas rubra]
MKLNHPMFAQIRAATLRLIDKGPSAATAAIQQALAELGLRDAAAAPATPAPAASAMRDINPPPAGAPAARQGDTIELDNGGAHAAKVGGGARREAPQAKAGGRDGNDNASGAAQGSPQAGAHEAAGGGGTPGQDAVAHATAVAQDMLNRMGIPVDIQASINAGMQAGMKNGLKNFDMKNFEMPKFDLGGDFSGLDLPGQQGPKAPPAPLPPGAKFISGSYANHAGSRNYKLYIPSSYHGQAMPLLVMLHGCTQDPDDFAAGTQMNQVAEEMQCLVVYPEQTRSANNSRCWNWFNAIDQRRGQGEPSLIAGIAQQVIEEYPVNERQVYVAGLSAGGAMAVIVGTLYPELFAAVGVHSGLPFASAQDLPSALSAMKRGAASPHKGGGSRPIIVFHGDRDTTVNPRNGEQVMAQGLGGGAAAAPSVQSGSVPNGHRYTQTTHNQADGSLLAEHWVVHGAGHAWSGGSTSGSYTDHKGPDASREMMRFFKTVS